MLGPKTAVGAKVRTAHIEVRIEIIEAKKGVATSQARTALIDDTMIGTEIATNGAEIKKMVIFVPVIETRKPKNELEQVGPPTNPSDLELLLL